MRLKNLLILLVFAFSSQIIQAQDAPEIQRPIITKVTATWCPLCGSWGWDLFEGLLEDNDQDAIFLNTHYSGDLLSSASSDIASNLNVNGQPKFFFNSSNTNANSANVATKRDEIKAMVATELTQAPMVNTGIEVTSDGSVYTVKTNTKFFQEMEGNVHLSLLVLESQVMNNQTPIGNVAHTYVIRGSESANTFGPQIATGTTPAGTELSAEYTIDVNAAWNNDNVTIAALLWTEDGGTYTYVNGNTTKPTIVSSLNANLENLYQASWRTNGANHLIQINSVEALGKTSIEVYNTAGQMISSTEENLSAGVHQIPVQNITTGSYFVTIKSELGTQTIKAQL